MSQPPDQIQPPPAQGATPPEGYAQQPGSAPPPGSVPPPGYVPPAPVAYAAAPPIPAGMWLDQASGLALPNGTALASPGRRIGAFFLAIPLSIITLGIGYLIWGLIVWGNGQTPALQVLGMRCWRPEEGRVAGFWWMALREVVGRIVDGILSIITELVSFFFMLSRPDRKTLHDLIAGTVVLHDPDNVLRG